MVAEITNNEAGRLVVHLGLGANLGNCKRTLQEAVLALGNEGFIVNVASSLYRTQPWGRPDQNDFLNCVIRGTWNKEPEQLLNIALEVERTMGRERNEEDRWGPRSLDIDILTAGTLSIRTDRLQVPHPRMAERRFVLAPLAEISPEWKHPETGITAEKMLSMCSDNGIVERLEEIWLVC